MNTHANLASDLSDFLTKTTTTVTIKFRGFPWSSSHSWICSMDWFCWKIYRKPWFLPSNIGVSCKCSHHPILGFVESTNGRTDAQASASDPSAPVEVVKLPRRGTWRAWRNDWDVLRLDMGHRDMGWNIYSKYYSISILRSLKIHRINNKDILNKTIPFVPCQPLLTYAGDELQQALPWRPYIFSRPLPCCHRVPQVPQVPWVTAARATSGSSAVDVWITGIL